MRGRGRGVDFSIYARAVPYLLRHPSILAMPLLAAVVDMLLSYTSGVATDPLGGLGSGIFAMIVQIVYLFAFGIAIIQANNIARGFKAGFDDAWDEGRRKGGSILLAAIGFQFIAYVAQYAGQLLAFVPYLPLILTLLAYFFLIYTIPAASIGGLPGGLAISGSIRAVRSHLVPSIVLAIVFAVVWIGIPEIFMLYVGNLPVIAYDLLLALARAIALAYLAFPFATTYDDIAFKLW